jgi:hypothetical protein
MTVDIVRPVQSGTSSLAELALTGTAIPATMAGYRRRMRAPGDTDVEPDVT